MEKEFIPYEEALAMKELGFDEICLGMFTHDKSLQWDGEHYHLPIKNSDAVEGALWITVPLWQQAFRWFREKHGLDSYTSPDEGVYRVGEKSYGYTINENHYRNGFSSPEEAQLACLKELIKIVKNE